MAVASGSQRCQLVRLAAATGAVIALLAGCGGGDPALPAAQRLDPTFVRTLDAWCASTSARFHSAEGAFPVADFDPAHPRADQLPAVGRYFAAGDAVRDTIPPGLDALGRPASGESTWATLKARTVASTGVARTQIAAARDDDTAAFAAAAGRAKQDSAAWSDLARSAGAPGDSPCFDLF